MNESTSSFVRRHVNRPQIALDSCVIMSAITPNEPYVDQCKSMLTAAGTEYRPVITKGVAGELFTKMVNQQDSLFRNKMFDFITGFLDSLQNKPLKINFLSDTYGHEEYLPSLKKNFSSVPADDLVHLSHIIAGNKALAQQGVPPIRFATIDTKIINPYIRRLLYAKWQLDIEDVTLRKF